MSEAITAVWMDAAVKGAVVLLLATLFALAQRRASAARRHLVWSAAVTALLLLPLLTVVLPAWGVLPTANAPVDGAVITTFDAPAEQVAKDAPAAVATATSATPASFPSTRAATDTPRFNVTRLLLLAWLAGMSAVLLSLAAAMVRVSWLNRRARRWTSGRVYEVARALWAEQGIRVEVLQGPVHAMPMVWGAFRPKLLLPSSAEAWPEARLRAVLQHELAHVRRRDAAWQLIAELACALHWFNPLVWYAAHRMRIEREHACDDAVLVAGSRASEYAMELLDIARSMRAARATSLAAIAMARPRQLEGRLLAVLDAGRNREAVSRRWPVWAATAVVVIPLAVLAPPVETASALPTADITAPRARREAKAAPAPAPETTPVRATVAFAPQSAQTPDCLKGAVQHMSISRSSNDDHTRVKWETKQCEGTLEIDGVAKIAGDLSGFASISPGGRVSIATEDPRTKRKLILTPSGDRFNYAYEVDGKRRAWDQDGQAWLASTLTLLVRHGGYAAEERVDYLLREKGVAGVLDEVALTDSDHTQRMYLQLLVRKTTLNPGAVRNVLEVAGREIESDYELAETLMSLTAKYGITSEARAAYIAAAGTLNSDYERTRALKAIVGKTELTPADQITVLELTAGMKSSYERAQVLKAMMPMTDLADTRVQDAYLKAATMESDYELRQVVSALLRRGRLNASGVDLVLNLAASIKSDYERAQLLSQLIRSQTFTPTQRERLVELTNEIDSEHERGRVASLLIRQMKN